MHAAVLWNSSEQTAVALDRFARLRLEPCAFFRTGERVVVRVDAGETEIALVAGRQPLLEVVPALLDHAGAVAVCELASRERQVAVGRRCERARLAELPLGRAALAEPLAAGKHGALVRGG